MAGASDRLSAGAVSTAADRLAASGDPKGRNGDAATTVRMRNKFSEYRSENPEAGTQFEEWLETQGYGIGDNSHVYKKD